jgi:hypothetical protein
MIVCDQLGIDFSDENLAALTALIESKKQAAETMQKQVQPVATNNTLDGKPGQSNITATDPNSQSATPEMPAEKMTDELNRYKRKALKHIGEAVEFESDVIPADQLNAIKTALSGCKTADEVKEVFERDAKPDEAAMVLRGLLATVEAMKANG